MTQDEIKDHHAYLEDEVACAKGDIRFYEERLEKAQSDLRHVQANLEEAENNLRAFAGQHRDEIEA